MLLQLHRDTFTDTTTTGVLKVDGLDFGFTLEDVDRGLRQGMPLADIAARKVKGATAIPTGKYRVWWDPTCRGTGCPRILNVPGFQGILIHVGNYAKDTAGCLLVGTQRGPDIVTHSKPAIAWLYPRIQAASSSPEGCWIEITSARA